MKNGIAATEPEPYGVGKWYIEKKIGIADFSNYTWSKYSTSITGISRYTTTGIPNVKYVANNRELGIALATKYQNHTGSGMSGVAYYFCIDVSMVQATDSSDTTPSGKLYYALKNTEYEEITNEELIEQLNEIQNMQMQDGETNIFWTGDVAPEMKLQYATKEELHAYITTEDGKKIRTDWRKIERRNKWKTRSK